jgi:hypothetical protein
MLSRYSLVGGALGVNVVLWGEFSRERFGVREYAPGSNGVTEWYGDPVGV